MTISVITPGLWARVRRAWRAAFELDATAMEYFERECGTQRTG